MKFVKKELESFEVRGKKYFVIKEKFQRLRERLSWWNKEVFGWIDLNVEKDVEELNDIELEMLNVRNLVPNDIQ